MSADHPLLTGARFGIMAGDNPLFHATAHGGHEGLHQELTRRQIPFHVVQGKYGKPERAFLLPGIGEEALRDLGERYGQESVIHSQGGQHRLVFTNGPRRGQSQQGHGHEVFEHPPEDMYTEWPGRGFFRLNLEGGTPHPNAYSWHDGHTDHHRSAAPDPVKKATQMEKLPPDAAGFPTPRGPANQGSTVVESGPQNMPVGEGMKLDRSLTKDEHDNPQFAPAGVATYGQFAQHYGGIGKPGAQNLKFYNYAGKGQAVNDLLRRHGYSHYYAGGKYGKPDLANKNYNTKHLMIYDPDPGTGGDFGEREYTDSWRKVHELAHALTYPEVNRLYGEGRRIGKLGSHRTPNEALRAVHWEHLAAHKQRELGAQLGIHIPDQDFHREYNTVMHDAAHRAVTGKFTDPNREGFQPHNKSVPLSTSLALVSGHAARMGLRPHETLKSKAAPSPVAKAETPIYAPVRGQASMADAKNEKLYTPEEARDILLKAAREKIDGFAKEIESLRKRELNKALIPVHAHKGASSASGGVEDVPAADMGKAEVLCKKCGKAHDLEKGCASKDAMAKGQGPTHVCAYPACGKGIRGNKDFCSAHSGKPVKKDEAKESPAYKTNEPAAPEGEKSSSDEHREMLKGDLNKVTPPGISEKTMHKLKAQYGGDKEKAYATAWAIHNKMKKALLSKAEEFVDNQGHMVENGIDPDSVLPPKASSKARSKGVVPQHQEKNGQELRAGEKAGSGGIVLPGAKLKRNPGNPAKDASARKFSEEGSDASDLVPDNKVDADQTYDKRGEGKNAPGPGRAAGDKTYSKKGAGANDKTYESVKKAMPSVPTAKPPKMGAAAPGTSSTSPAMVKAGFKDKVAAAALAAGTALTAGAIPAAHHESAKRVESRIKLPGAHLRPAGPQLPMTKGQGNLDTWAGEGIPERSEQSKSPKPKYTMEDLKAAKAKLSAPKPAKKAEGNEALLNDAPSRQDIGRNEVLQDAPPSSKDIGRNDALRSVPPSSKDIGRNNVLGDAPPSKGSSGLNNALVSAAVSGAVQGLKNAALIDAAVQKGDLEKGVPEEHQQRIAAQDAKMPKPIRDVMSPSPAPTSAPLPSQRPQLSARPGPLANKTPAAPAPKKPGIFGKLQGK